MNDGITIREAEKRDIPLIARTLNSMYTLQRPGEFYTWQFFENPNSSKLICGFSKNELIGTFGVQKRQLTNGLLCGQLSWLNIAPKWQGKGWFRKLGEAALRGSGDLDVLCIFANASARSVSQRTFGFKIIGAIKMLQLDSTDRIENVPVSYYPVDRKTVFPLVKNSGINNVMFQYSQEFRKWRFASNPMYRYDMIKLNSGEFIITKSFTDPATRSRYGDIVDLECALDDKNKLGALYSRACSHLRNKGATQITTWALPGSPLRSVVEKMGFKEANHETHWAVKVPNKDYEYLYDFARWHLKQADATNY